MVASNSLSSIGYTEGLLEGLVDLLRNEDTFVPAILVDLYRRYPEKVESVFLDPTDYSPIK